MAAKKKPVPKPEPPPEREPEEKKKSSDRGLFLLLGAVVLGLGALVYWSLPKGGAAGGDDASTTPDASLASSDGASNKPLAVFERLPSTISEFSIVTAKPEDVVRKMASSEAIAKLLDVRHCGASCDTLKKTMSDEDRFEVDVLKTEEVILPPEDTMDTVAPMLTVDERKNIHSRPWAVVIRTQGPPTPDQLSARTAFATALALAEALDGVIYDEACRRIDSVRDFPQRLVTSKIGEPAFRPKHIVIQLLKEEDGAARLNTLGMARFGTPDFIVRGPDMSDGPLLADLLNAVIFQIVAGKDALPLVIGLEDVARAQGKKATDLMSDPSTSKAVKLDVVKAERAEGDADNDIVELVPDGTTTWSEVLQDLFGKVRTVSAPIDKDIAKRAQKDLPNALKRSQRGEGELFVKGPFPIPPASRADGGPTMEYLWISVASCDDASCKGALANTPSYANNLAAGKTTSVARKDVVDWVIRLSDGGLSGGESIKALQQASGLRPQPSEKK
jgi:uncharacterized protein YegJ (DUF2314 family)